MLGWTDDALVNALRSGDEAAFAQLVNTWSRSMMRVARAFVSTDASAEEVLQDTWLAVIQGIDGFEGRCSPRTWVYRILVNTAKKRGVKERRTIPWTTLAPRDEDLGPTIEPTAFQGPGDRHPGGWRAFPTPWHSAPEDSTESKVLSSEMQAQLRTALDGLPERQRIVVTLRDVLGHSSDEVCEMLDVSESNQRVLLHRGRARLRQLLDAYLVGPAVGATS